MRRQRRNPAERNYYAGIYTPDGAFVEAVQSTRKQALSRASHRAQPGEIVRGFTMPPGASCLKLVEAFVKEP